MVNMLREPITQVHAADLTTYGYFIVWIMLLLFKFVEFLMAYAALPPED